jgi:hypothetical protein
VSIVRSCVRLATVAARRDKTWAETRVLDSDNGPLEAAIKAEPTPYIVVYSDDDDRDEIQGFDFIGAKRTLLIVIEFGLAAALTPSDGGPTMRIPATDGAFELALDILERQIINALVHDPTSTWGALWHDLARRFDLKASSKRGGSSEGGSRWAARQLLLHVDPIADPPPGVVLPDAHPVPCFLAAVRAADADGSLVGFGGAADLIEAALPTVNAPDWRQAQAWLGLTEFDARALGLGPPVIPQEAPSTIEGLNTEGTGMTEKTDIERVVGDHEPKPPPPSGIPWPRRLTYPLNV